MQNFYENFMQKLDNFPSTFYLLIHLKKVVLAICKLSINIQT